MFQVWIVLFVFMVLTTVVLVILDFRSCQRGILNAFNSYGWFVFQTVASQSPSGNNYACDFVLFYNFFNNLNNNLKLGGGLFTGSYTKGLKMRLVIGAWCLASLLLATAYSSVLASFIMAPHYHTLVDTVEQLANNEKVIPLVLKGYSSDISITVMYIHLHNLLIDAQTSNFVCFKDIYRCTN